MHRTSPCGEIAARRLSEIIKEMALRLRTHPEAGSSEPATVAVFMLAGAAWNSAIGNNVMREEHRELIDQLTDQVVWEDVTSREELRSSHTERLISELVDYKRKREHDPNDLRRVVATEMSRRGTSGLTGPSPTRSSPLRSGLHA